MQKWHLSKFAHLANTKNDTQQIAYLASMRCKSMSKNAFQILQTVHLVKTQKRHCQNLRFIKCAKMSLSKFAHLANTKNDIQKIAYLAGRRCKSMSKNAFQILQNEYLVKTQKRHCQNLRFIKCAKMALVKICTFSSLPQQSSFQQNESAK